MDALSISVISLIVLVIISFVFLPVLRHKLSVRDGMKFYFDGRYQLFVFAHSRFDKVREGKQVYERYRDFVKALYNKDTGGWNYKGGTFGKFRNGNQNNHNGIDFAAAPGTPIYAPYDGTVIATRTNAPNFHEEKKWVIILQ